MKRVFKSLYFSNLLYYVTAGEVTFLVFGFFFPLIFEIAQYTLFGVFALLCFDIFLLFANTNGIWAKRNTTDKLSNGDQNSIHIHIENRFLFPVRISIIDELPFQFQSRNLVFNLPLNSSEKKTVEYHVRPVKRGEYEFGAMNVYVRSPIGLVQRRFIFSQNAL